jgi:organic radical activating enzyme
LKKITPQITQLLQHLGWIVNLEKSSLIPSNQFKYLHLLEERKSNILQELKKSMKKIKFKKYTPIKILAKLIEKLSTSQTKFTQASLYLKQLLDCLNIRINKPRLISINPTYQAMITTDVFPIAWGVTFQVVKQNTKINPKKEMQKLSQEEKNLVILSEKASFIVQQI